MVVPYHPNNHQHTQTTMIEDNVQKYLDEYKRMYNERFGPAPTIDVRKESASRLFGIVGYRATGKTTALIKLLVEDQFAFLVEPSHQMAQHTRMTCYRDHGVDLRDRIIVPDRLVWTKMVGVRYEKISKVLLDEFYYLPDRTRDEIVLNLQHIMLRGDAAPDFHAFFISS
jgi:hypothetical protein